MSLDLVKHLLEFSHLAVQDLHGRHAVFRHERQHFCRDVQDVLVKLRVLLQRLRVHRADIIQHRRDEWLHCTIPWRTRPKIALRAGVEVHGVVEFSLSQWTKFLRFDTHIIRAFWSVRCGAVVLHPGAEGFPNVRGFPLVVLMLIPPILVKEEVFPFWRSLSLRVLVLQHKKHNVLQRGPGQHVDEGTAKHEDVIPLWVRHVVRHGLGRGAAVDVPSKTVECLFKLFNALLLGRRRMLEIRELHRHLPRFSILLRMIKLQRNAIERQKVVDHAQLVKVPDSRQR
mmetsp:Transcript_69837/g.197883  ORF Transcript_69837/g.197883 Transcript_69837/m.197883 type:complete len:284 (+) Transcript_69837:181-1032(+)